MSAAVHEVSVLTAASWTALRMHARNMRCSMWLSTGTGVRCFILLPDFYSDCGCACYACSACCGDASYHSVHKSDQDYCNHAGISTVCFCFVQASTGATKAQVHASPAAHAVVKAPLAGADMQQQPGLQPRWLSVADRYARTVHHI